MVHQYRLLWMQVMLQRITGCGFFTLVGNLVSSVSILPQPRCIIAGILAGDDRGRRFRFASSFAFVRPESKVMWEIKLDTAGDFCFTPISNLRRSLRQFNLLSILIGGAPLPGASDAGATAVRAERNRVPSPVLLAMISIPRDPCVLFCTCCTAAWLGSSRHCSCLPLRVVWILSPAGIIVPEH